MARRHRFHTHNSTYHVMLRGNTRNEAKSNFEKYVLNGIGIKTTYDFKSGLMNGMIGNDEFVNEVLSIATTKPKIKIELPLLIDKVCEQINVSIEEFYAPGKGLRPSHARAIVSLLIREIDGLSLEQLGKLLDRDPSGLTKLANRLKTKCTKDPLAEEQVQKMREWILNPMGQTQSMSGCQA